MRLISSVNMDAKQRHRSTKVIRDIWKTIKDIREKSKILKYGNLEQDRQIAKLFAPISQPIKEISTKLVDVKKEVKDEIKQETPDKDVVKRKIYGRKANQINVDFKRDKSEPASIIPAPPTFIAPNTIDILSPTPSTTGILGETLPSAGDDDDDEVFMAGLEAGAAAEESLIAYLSGLTPEVIKDYIDQYPETLRKYVEL